MAHSVSSQQPKPIIFMVGKPQDNEDSEGLACKDLLIRAYPTSPERFHETFARLQQRHPRRNFTATVDLTGEKGKSLVQSFAEAMMSISLNNQAAASSSPARSPQPSGNPFAQREGSPPLLSYPAASSSAFPASQASAPDPNASTSELDSLGKSVIALSHSKAASRFTLPAVRTEGGFSFKMDHSALQLTSLIVVEEETASELYFRAVVKGTNSLGGSVKCVFSLPISEKSGPTTFLASEKEWFVGYPGVKSLEPATIQLFFT